MREIFLENLNQTKMNKEERNELIGAWTTALLIGLVVIFAMVACIQAIFQILW